MQSNSNWKKDKALGMSLGTATHRLRKAVMLHLLEATGKNSCYRCGQSMTVADFSIDHKVDWLHSDSPVEKFFDLENIAFSHMSCNIRASLLKSDCTRHSGTQQTRHVKSASGFKGVHFCGGEKFKKAPWSAVVTKDKKKFFAGRYPTPEEAASAFDTKAIELYGPDAITNKNLGLLETQQGNAP